MAEVVLVFACSQYLPEPKTFLHGVDPRVKQLWLLAFYVLLSRAAMPLQLLTSCTLAALAAAVLPANTFRSQLRNLAFLVVYLAVVTAIFGDPSPPGPVETPPPADGLLPGREFTSSSFRFTYVNLFDLIVVTRKSLRLAVTVACVVFCVLLSATLVLTTTPPEALTAGLRWYLRPLYIFRSVALERICFTLVLAVRFLSVVFEELRNLCLGLAARGVAWEKQGFRGAVGIYGTLFGRLFSNLFARCANVTDALVLRGYEGAGKHVFYYCLTQPRTRWSNSLALLLLLAALIAATIRWPS